jgi:uncharacterized peroxidase-related enzyme
LVDSIKEDYTQADLQSADRSMLDFAVKLTKQPEAMTQADVETLRRLGYDDEALLEIVHVTGYFNYINRVADGLGIDPEPNW